MEAKTLPNLKKDFDNFWVYLKKKGFSMFPNKRIAFLFYQAGSINELRKSNEWMRSQIKKRGFK